MTYTIDMKRSSGGNGYAVSGGAGIGRTISCTSKYSRASEWCGWARRYYFSTFNSPNLNSEPISQTGNDLCIERVGLIVRKGST
jgi:hypothetical protein